MVSFLQNNEFELVLTLLGKNPSKNEVFWAVCHCHPLSKGPSLEWLKIKAENDVLMRSLFETGFMGESKNLRKQKADTQLVAQIRLEMEINSKSLRTAMSMRRSTGVVSRIFTILHGLSRVVTTYHENSRKFTKIHCQKHGE